MGERKRRSKKRSSSKPLLKGFTLYLCNCVDYDEVADTLRRNGIRFQRHRDHFASHVPDTELLRKVGRRRWILITADKKQRVRPLERKLILQYNVREFVFTSGEVGNVGELLVQVRRKMRNLCSNNEGPFVASISKSGNIALRDLGGSVNDIVQI
jgi:hypothetical protein